MSMSTISLLLLTIAIVWIEAKPLAENIDPMYTGRRQADLSARAATLHHPSNRHARQGFFSPYDYYGGLSYDTNMYSDYYQPQTNYISTDYHYQQPIRRQPARRRNARPFGPTTQKYTIWDLARKWELIHFWIATHSTIKGNRRRRRQFHEHLLW